MSSGSLSNLLACLTRKEAGAKLMSQMLKDVGIYTSRGAIHERQERRAVHDEQESPLGERGVPGGAG